jgi:hypothetical protein
MVKKKVREPINGKMVTSMMENIVKTRGVDREQCNGLVEIFILVDMTMT